MSIFNLKKSGRKHAAGLHTHLTEWAMPKFSRLTAHLRCAGRIRLLNRWGRKNPKKIVAIYAAFCVVFLCLNTILDFIPAHNAVPQTDRTMSENLSCMVAADPLSGVGTINRNREAISSAVREYARAQCMVSRQIDSLMRLDNKTRRDTLQIYNLYMKLKNDSEPL